MVQLCLGEWRPEEPIERGRRVKFQRIQIKCESDCGISPDRVVRLQPANSCKPQKPRIEFRVSRMHCDQELIDAALLAHWAMKAIKSLIRLRLISSRRSARQETSATDMP